jgi:hypothetical protein
MEAMKITVLSTGTNNVPMIYGPLVQLGHTIDVIVYDEMTLDQHRNLPLMVERLDPDLVLYIGAIEEHHGKPVPRVHVLAEIGAVWPMVHLCFDGAEPYWWKQLDRYYDQGRFALQVNIDGVRVGPIGDRGLTTLCPIDAKTFKNIPWEKRSILCGFAGGMHHGRPPIINPLRDSGHVVHRDRDQSDTNKGFRSFLEDCRVGINVAHTGGGWGGMHVKARVAGELPAAGCLVLEQRGSPLADWFDAGQDYLEYDSIDDAKAKIDWVSANQGVAREMALRMRAKVLERHSPAVFWSQVLERLGMGEALRPPAQIPHHHWFHSAPPGSLPPRLVKSVKASNLVDWNGKIHVVPQNLGPIEVDKVKHPQIRIFDTIHQAEAAAR